MIISFETPRGIEKIIPKMQNMPNPINLLYFLIIFVIGFDDHLNKFVADNVYAAKVYKFNTFDILKDVKCL